MLRRGREARKERERENVYAACERGRGRREGGRADLARVNAIE